ncbi:SPW repeat protein [Streptomyces sp. NPDC052682]|uniref:SPW repeat protein n=1 Tax=Streptomyces sp. NPDC052682 TaxID=3154954 RepID=UPI0034122913
MATTPHSSIETHPDILDMRARHEMAERAATTPRAQAVETLAFLTGLYLAASPWIVGFDNLRPLAVNNLIVGIAYALLMSGGFGRAYERTHSMAWAACALGAWTIVAPWVIAGDMSTTRSVTNNIIVGALALLLGLVASAAARRTDSAGSRRPSRAGGMAGGTPGGDRGMPAP